MMEFLILFSILLAFLRPGFIDFYLKEQYKTKVQWKDIPDFFHHKPADKKTWKYGWHVVIQSESIINLVLLCFVFGSLKPLAGLLILYTEDLYYYLFTWLKYKKPLPDNLPWLNPFGNSFPKKYFLVIYSFLLTATVLIIWRL